MVEKDLIEISKDDLEFIVGEEFKELKELARSNCFCLKCRSRDEKPEMIEYKMYLNDINDVIFQGKCKTCGSEIARYFEIGERKEYSLKIRYIKEKRK